MSVKSKLYYWLQCDGCQVRSTDSDDYSAWIDESSALEMAEARDWLIRDDRHLCERCSSELRCPECGEFRSAVDAACPCDQKERTA